MEEYRIVIDKQIYRSKQRDNLCYTHKKKLWTLESSNLNWPTSIPAAKISQKKPRWRQDAFEDTVKPLYNAPVYRGHPVYDGHWTTSRNFQLPYIFCKVYLYIAVTLYYNSHLAISQGWPLYTGLTVNSKVCEVHSLKRPGGLAHVCHDHLITHTNNVLFLRTYPSERFLMRIDILLPWFWIHVEMFSSQFLYHSF